MSRSLDQEATQWSKPKRTNGRSLERLPRELATATLVVMIVGFVLGIAGTYGIQWRFAGDAPWKAFLKAVLAGVVVGLPWPVGGTLFGGWVLLFSGLGNAKKELRDRQPPEGRRSCDRFGTNYPETANNVEKVKQWLRTS